MSSLASTNSYLHPAAASAAEDPTKSYKGFKFIFAINASTKPGENIWHVPNRRFMLTEFQTTKLFGQYITSNWYSKQYSKGTCIRFAVLMVQNDCAIATVEKDLNSSVSVALRPEKIRIDKNKTENSIEAKVNNASFVGSSYQYILNSKIGKVYVISKETNQTFKVGDEVYLTFNEEDVKILND